MPHGAFWGMAGQFVLKWQFIVSTVKYVICAMNDFMSLRLFAISQSPNCTLSFSCPTSIYAKVLINGNSSTSRVSVQIFSIVNMNVLYLHCQVNICIKTGEESCVPVSKEGYEIIMNTFLMEGIKFSG